MRRLYLKIYLTVIAVLVLVLIIAGGIWRFSAGGPPGSQAFEIAGELAIRYRRRVSRNPCSNRP